MTNPTFSPGDVAWHVRHGKVTLEVHKPDYAVIRLTDSVCDFVGWNGKECPNDVGRVLYTLDEARQYGWHTEGDEPKGRAREPRTVEFKEVVTPDLWIHMDRLVPELRGKRVRVRVEEVIE